MTLSAVRGKNARYMHILSVVVVTVVVVVKNSLTRGLYALSLGPVS